MISKPSPAWRMLSRMIDTLMGELSQDDLDDLHARVQRKRNRRWLDSRRPRPHNGEEVMP